MPGRIVVELEVQDYAGVSVAALMDARIDHRSADTVEVKLMHEVELIASRDGQLVVDLGNVEFISSVGLRVLNVALRHTRANGGAIHLAAPGETVAEILKIARFHMLFAIHETVADALGAISPEAAAAYTAGVD